jgi:hypothetical protein
MGEKRNKETRRENVRAATTLAPGWVECNPRKGSWLLVAGWVDACQAPLRTSCKDFLHGAVSFVDGGIGFSAGARV